MSSKKQREITQTGKTGNTASPAGPVWLSTGEDGCILAVHAQPGAKRNAVAGIYNDRLKIALSAPPVDGKANAMLIRFIAETAGVPKSAVAVVGSMFSFPVFGSKCAPVQHMVNVLCAVLLGPWYGVGAAFVASLLRNLLGLGSLMAFPGSMCGALLCGIVYHKTHKLLPTLIGEVFGTGIIGGLLAWPVAILFMGKAAGDIAFYAYIVPFLVSTVGGSIIAGIILFALEKNGTLKSMQNALNK